MLIFNYGPMTDLSLTEWRSMNRGLSHWTWPELMFLVLTHKKEKCVQATTLSLCHINSILIIVACILLFTGSNGQYVFQ